MELEAQLKKPEAFKMLKCHGYNMLCDSKQPYFTFILYAFLDFKDLLTSDDMMRCVISRCSSSMPWLMTQTMTVFKETKWCRWHAGFLRWHIPWRESFVQGRPLVEGTTSGRRRGAKNMPDDVVLKCRRTVSGVCFVTSVLGNMCSWQPAQHVAVGPNFSEVR